MRQTLDQILALQDVNRRMEHIRHDMDGLSIDERNQARLVEEMKRRAEQLHRERLNAAKQADATELKIRTAEEDNARLKLQLNVTKHQKDYDAIQRAILSHQADIERWEDAELAALQGTDELAEQEQQLAEEIRQAEQKLQRMQEEVASQIAEKTHGLQKLQDECDRVREQINPAVLSAYERLAASRSHNALAEVRNRICQGCFTQITKQTENLLMRDSEVIYCASCGRMLVLGDQ